MRLRNIINACLTLTILLTAPLTTIADGVIVGGTLVGSMVFVDQQETTHLGDASNAVVDLKHAKRQLSVLSDRNGDFIRKLPRGKYCLHSARDAGGRSLVFSPHQHKCFQIRSGKPTRFDVMFVKM